MLQGCHTALISPFNADLSLNQEGVEKLVAYQIAEGINGILACGTTAESPTLSGDEQSLITRIVCGQAKEQCRAIAGAGSNSTAKTLKAAEYAAQVGADSILLVDPYYNGPSSLEIRKEYVAPVAKAFPELDMIPYVIPGRSGTKLLPEDLGILFGEYKNVSTVKEATGDLDNMARTRECCGDGFSIMSGDDDKTFDMMTDARIKAAGVISVMSNVVPGAVTQFVKALRAGDLAAAEKWREALKPLFGMVGVVTQEPTPYGPAEVKSRNPVPVKTLMNILGMPAGPCRQPMGKMNQPGLDIVLENARQVQANNPEVFAPIASFFGVDIDQRLQDASVLEGLAY
ncbi:MAG: 4-hydroxy-tetrahydrodipicolinate synthase [Candidatus Latescibacterota bacterium]|jgi:4-hydroxy-tetrahydrodipicolinate synthase